MDNIGFFLLGGAALIFLVSLYFLPTIEAVRRGSPEVSAILVLNFFLGWLLIPWVIAMTWAYRSHPTQHQDMDTRSCPYCAEMIRPQAIKCKHCGSELLPLSL